MYATPLLENGRQGAILPIEPPSVKHKQSVEVSHDPLRKYFILTPSVPMDGTTEENKKLEARHKAVMQEFSKFYPSQQVFVQLCRGEGSACRCCYGKCDVVKACMRTERDTC